MAFKRDQRVVFSTRYAGRETTGSGKVVAVHATSRGEFVEIACDDGASKKVRPVNVSVAA